MRGTRREMVINSFKSADPSVHKHRRCRRFWLTHGPHSRTSAEMTEYWSSSSSTAATSDQTLVPFDDEGYAGTESRLRLPEKRLIRVNGRVGLHPALSGLAKLLENGHLALVPGVGYPNPNRSHFESMLIWQTARLDLEEHGGPGWIGRSFE